MRVQLGTQVNQIEIGNPCDELQRDKIAAKVYQSHEICEFIVCSSSRKTTPFWLHLCELAVF